MKTFRKTLSVLLAVIMLVGILPAAHFDFNPATVAHAKDYSLSDFPEIPMEGRAEFVIYIEGYRNNRTELVVFNVFDYSQKLMFLSGIVVGYANQNNWTDGLAYYLDTDNNEWVYFGKGGRFVTENSRGVLLSSLDVYNNNGEIAVIGLNNSNTTIPQEYNSHRYEIFETAGLSWTEAKEACEKKGGHLATITSEGEQNYLEACLKKSSNDSYGYYLGATLNSTTDNYAWITGEDWTYDNWRQGEPSKSGYYGETETVLSILNYTYAFGWNDVGEMGASNDPECMGFICEWDDVPLNPEEHVHNWCFNRDNTSIVCSKCQEEYLLSPKFGFKYGRDDFNFEHKDIGSAGISKIGLKYMNPALKIDAWCFFVNGLTAGMKYVINKAEGNNYGFWGGSCYGIACMDSSLLSTISPEKYGGNTVYELPLSTKLKDSINILMYTQCSLLYCVNLAGNLIENKLKDTVTAAKMISSSGYLPVIGYQIPGEGHSVTLIGILPDDFMHGWYAIAAYDCNNTKVGEDGNIYGEPIFIFISDDYKEVYRGKLSADINVNFEYKKIDSITSVFTGDLNNINTWAPGLINSSLYPAFYAPKKNESFSDSFDIQNDDIYNDYVRFLVASDSVLTVNGDDGSFFSYNGEEVTETNIDALYSVTNDYLGVTAVIVPYSANSYEITSNQQYYANVSYNQNYATYYCENGGTSIYDCYGKSKINTKQTGSYFELSAYKYGMIAGSDIIAVGASGNASETTLDFSSNEPKIESDKLNDLDIFIQHDDDEFSINNIKPEGDECAKSITIHTEDSESGKIDISYHEEHDYTLINVVDPSCTEFGYTGDEYCMICKQIVHNGETVNALGHADIDENGNCNRCGAHIADAAGENKEQQQNNCKWCGKPHKGFWGMIVGFFHKIAYFFAHLFGKM
ncbi:MAG: hypothetical protein K6G90_10740 [Clostridia bacterium]|nr:hypothetical protein [Clostridia bacterium]